MKSILSLCMLLYLICLCESMDRHRNKKCHTAMTCIHSGREKCGQDGQGNYRRFYDTCDLLEFNCLKGKNYENTLKDNCQYLLPIDDEPQDTEKNNPANTSKGSPDDTAMEGTIYIDDNGDIKGEVIMDDDRMEKSPVDEKAMDEAEINQDNTGVEGEIVVEDDGAIEGNVTVNDDVVPDNEKVIDKTEFNEDNPGVEGEIIVEDDGAIEGKVEINDDIESVRLLGMDLGKKKVVFDEQFNGEAGIEGEVKPNGQAVEYVRENNAVVAPESNPTVADVLAPAVRENVHLNLAVNNKSAVKNPQKMKKLQMRTTSQ